MKKVLFLYVSSYRKRLKRKLIRVSIKEGDLIPTEKELQY